MIALAGLPGHHLFMNAPPTGAQIFRIVLMNHEAWGCDLDECGINGPDWCFQLYLLWTGASFVRSEAWGNRGDEGREKAILSTESRRSAGQGCHLVQWWPLSRWRLDSACDGCFGRQCPPDRGCSCMRLFSLVSWPGELPVGLFASAMSTQSSGVSCLPPERSLKVVESVYCSGVQSLRSGHHL
jgi:hypothetical protein